LDRRAPGTSRGAHVRRHRAVDTLDPRDRADQLLRLEQELVAHRARRRGELELERDDAVLDVEVFDEPERDDVLMKIRILDLRELREDLLFGDHYLANCMRLNASASLGAGPSPLNSFARFSARSRIRLSSSSGRPICVLWQRSAATLRSNDSLMSIHTFGSREPQRYTSRTLCGIRPACSCSGKLSRSRAVG